MTKMKTLTRIYACYWLAMALTLTAIATADLSWNKEHSETRMQKCATEVAACRCYRQSGIYSIVCVGAALRDIPNSFDFYAAQIFNFSGNQLTRVRKDAFRKAHLDRLEIVDLSGNRIRKMASNALSNLANLLEIDLSNNELRTVHAKMFRNNRFLNTIRLRGNPIRELGEHAFPFSIYLKTLDLQGCKLNKIHPYAFANTPLLEDLNLKDNALTSPPMKVLRLTRLRLLQLDGNPWKCDANLWRVLKWSQNKANADTGGAGHQPQPQSLLCVFGETDNAVFWDTMEADNFEKFQTLARRRRFRRAISGHHKTDKNADRTQPKPEAAPFITSNSHPHPLPHPQIVPDSSNINNKPTTTSATGCAQPLEYSPTRYLDNLYKPKVATPIVATAAAATAASSVDVGVGGIVPIVKLPPNAYNSASRNIAYNNVEIARNYVEQAERRRSRDAFPSEFRNENVATAEQWQSSGDVRFDHRDEDKKDDAHAAGTDSSTDDIDTASDNSSLYDDGDNFIERNHVMILGAELILIAILLIILYQLWEEKRKRCHSGVNTPLNNGSVQIKSYDTQISGYKRYSLSDEEYSNIRNTTGGDAESGYLSYHRYNSIEGENTGVPIVAAAATTTTSNYDCGGTGGNGNGTSSYHRETLYYNRNKNKNQDEDDDDDNYEGNANRNRGDVVNIYQSQGNLNQATGDDDGGIASRQHWRTIPRRWSQRERKRDLSSFTNTNTNTSLPK